MTPERVLTLALLTALVLIVFVVLLKLVGVEVRW